MQNTCIVLMCQNFYIQIKIDNLLDFSIKLSLKLITLQKIIFLI